MLLLIDFVSLSKNHLFSGNIGLCATLFLDYVLCDLWAFWLNFFTVFGEFFFLLQFCVLWLSFAFVLKYFLFVWQARSHSNANMKAVIEGLQIVLTVRSILMCTPVTSRIIVRLRDVTKVTHIRARCVNTWRYMRSQCLRKCLLMGTMCRPPVRVPGMIVTIIVARHRMRRIVPQWWLSTVRRARWTNASSNSSSTLTTRSQASSLYWRMDTRTVTPTLMCPLRQCWPPYRTMECWPTTMAPPTLPTGTCRSRRECPHHPAMSRRHWVIRSHRFTITTTTIIITIHIWTLPSRTKWALKPLWSFDNCT